MALLVFFVVSLEHTRLLLDAVQMILGCGLALRSSQETQFKMLGTTVTGGRGINTVPSGVYFVLPQA